jgi:hypothetical protein
MAMIFIAFLLISSQIADYQDEANRLNQQIAEGRSNKVVAVLPRINPSRGVLGVIKLPRRANLKGRSVEYSGRCRSL